MERQNEKEMKFICKKCGSTDYKIIEKSNGNDIERVLMHLSHSSVYDVIKELSPYRERLAKGENWGDEK